MMTQKDLHYLQRCVLLAQKALEGGDEPFGSILVSKDGQILFEDHNRIKGGDHTQHPEFNIARWAGQNMTPEERKEATVYTSGEHCPMCSAAHGWAGLGRIVYASSAKQLASWLKEWGAPAPAVKPLSIQEIINSPIEIDGPEATLETVIKDMQYESFQKTRNI